MSKRKLRMRCGLDQTLIVNRLGNVEQFCRDDVEHVIERQYTGEFARKPYNRKAPHSDSPHLLQTRCDGYIFPGGHGLTRHHIAHP